MSESMSKLAAFLKDDPILGHVNDKEEKRRLIQNNFDAARYADPMLKNLTKIMVPLSGPKALLQVVDCQNSN